MPKSLLALFTLIAIFGAIMLAVALHEPRPVEADIVCTLGGEHMTFAATNLVTRSQTYRFTDGDREVIAPVSACIITQDVKTPR